VLSSSTVWQVSAYARRGRATSYGSPGDTPVTIDAARANRRHGAVWSVTYQRGRHTLKTGGELSALRLSERFMFAVIDAQAGDESGLSEGAIGHDPSSPFMFAAAGRPTLWSGYVQDVVQASSRLTLNFGVRFDHSRLLMPASQWSPRLGAAYQVFAATTIRASFMRLFQPPQTEYLLLASSAGARALSPFVDGADGGGSTIPPERQTAFDAAVSQQLAGGWQLEAGTWRRRVTNVSDPNVFFGTTVTVPNSVARQEAWGFEARLDMPLRRGWSGSAGYTHGRAVQFGPITGGLFLEDEYLEIRDGTRFIPDHDQRHALGLSAIYRNQRRDWQVSGAFRYQTGTPLGIEEDDVDELVGRPGSEVVDVAAGRVRPRAVADIHARWTFHRGPRARLSLAAWVNNVTDTLYAYNFGNPFSGTHFGAPRSGGASLTVRFGRTRP
jgi:outer membrane receptor protein involved in Fe transport